MSMLHLLLALTDSLPRLTYLEGNFQRAEETRPNRNLIPNPNPNLTPNLNPNLDPGWRKSTARRC